MGSNVSSKGRGEALAKKHVTILGTFSLFNSGLAVFQIHIANMDAAKFAKALFIKSSLTVPKLVEIANTKLFRTLMGVPVPVENNCGSGSVAKRSTNPEEI